MNKQTAIFYSGATDVTGKALVEALEVNGCSSKPTGVKLVIGWGAKAEGQVAFGGDVKVLNHPERIRDNRNKVKTLHTLKKSNVPVASFTEAATINNALANGTLTLPVIGRTNFHQGGKGFWLCLTKNHITNAINEGAQYFQNYLDMTDEYRIHVFGGEVIYAQKKIKRDNMSDAFEEQHAEKIINSAEKSGKKVDKDTLTYTLEQVGKRLQPQADMIIRSNTRGWKFVSVTTNKLSKALAEVAIAAVKAVGLDFGAVDCCITEQGPYIIEINSGPGLEKTAFEKYVACFKKVISDTFTEKPKNTKSPEPETLQFKSAKKAEVSNLVTKTKLMLEMAESADEVEAAALEKVFAKMFNK